MIVESFLTPTSGSMILYPFNAINGTAPAPPHRFRDPVPGSGVPGRFANGAIQGQGSSSGVFLTIRSSSS